MGARLFDTYHASPEEIVGIRRALDAAGIAYYETDKGFFGLGAAAIWVARNDDYAAARRVVDAFQHEWRARVRSEPPRGIRWARLPVLIVVVALVLYLNLHWFFL